MSSDVTEPSREDGAVEAFTELTELDELDPPMDELDEELGTLLLPRELFEVEAMGADTLLACVELGKGRAIVMAC